MALWPSYEYAEKRAQKVGIKKFLKTGFYFLGAYTAYGINLATMYSTQSLPHADISLFSNEIASNFGRGLSDAGNLFFFFTITHLYGTQAGHFLSNIKKGFKKTGFGLMTHLEYGLTRHPAYLGLRAACFGYFLQKPTIGNALACAILFLTTELSSRGEEKYLEMMWGERYKEYKKKVPRWIPRPKGILELIKNPRIVKEKLEQDIDVAVLLREKYTMPEGKFKDLLKKLRETDPLIPTVLDE